MEAPPVYLDHNASTPILPQVLDAMLPYLREHFGNPSSGHVFGQHAHRAVEESRQQVAAFLGASPQQVLFTSGGTESNNLAIRGVAASLGRPGRIVSSVIEHPATLQPCRHLERQGWDLFLLPVDGTGRFRVEDLEAQLERGVDLVTIMHANNETGVIQPIGPALRAAHAHGALFHTDAAQSAGKIPLNVQEFGVDLLSLAGHKLYAPKGVGALYLRSGTILEPLLRGAGHERGLRPGTENVASIVGLGAACQVARATQERERLRVAGLRDLLQHLLLSAIPGAAVNGGKAAPRLPNTLSVRFPGVTGSQLLALAPQVAASTGSACHEGGERPSQVLMAMGLDAVAAMGTLRLSLGRGSTEEEIRRAAGAIIAAWKTARGA